MKYVDIHSHLEMCKNHEEFIKRAEKKNILIVSTGIDIDSNRRVLEIKQKFPEIQISKNWI